MRKMFSKKQIIEMIQEFAPELTPEEIASKLSEQDIVGKTLKQSQANWKLTNVVVEQSPAATTLGLTHEAVYNAIEEINGILYIVFINKFKNETESSISATYASYMTCDIDLPSDIASKIFDYDGKSVAETDSLQVISLGYRGGLKVGASYYEIAGELKNTGTANRMQLKVSPNSNFSVPAGGEAILEDRLFLTLL